MAHSSMLPDLVIFDFAGTMLRDDGAVLAAYRRALTAHDIPFTEADLGARIALSSGFDRGLVELLVERLGWDRLFDRVLAAEDAPAGRPAPYSIFRAMMDLGAHDLARVAVVGDTPLDLEAG